MNYSLMAVAGLFVSGVSLRSNASILSGLVECLGPLPVRGPTLYDLGAR
jgi:hypothetical protein